MKAAIFVGASRPLEVQNVPPPEIQPDEILVRVAACGLCHTDLHYIDHNVPTFKKPPVILGHEASGIVERVGPKADSFKAGDRVLIPAVLTCGECALCRSGRSNICEKMRMYGNHIDGAFAEYVAAPARQTFKLPDSIPLEEACIIGDAITTAFHAVVNRGRVRPGDTVAVFGCGGVGINVVQMAAAHGAEVIAIDTVRAKLELAQRLGAKSVQLARPGLVKELKQAGGVSVAFECIGNPAVIREAHESIRRGGRLCIVGYSERPAELAVAKVMFNEQEIVGSLGCPPEEFPKVLALIQQGKIQVQPLVTGRFPLAKINEGLDRLRQGEGIRNIVLMN
jgi:6-hydroxycyclohex-1-ene-1-carbonyl-CoA dehydrogenase